MVRPPRRQSAAHSAAAAAAAACHCLLLHTAPAPTPPPPRRPPVARAHLPGLRRRAAGGDGRARRQPALVPRARLQPPARGVGRLPGLPLRRPGGAAGGRARGGVRARRGRPAALCARVPRGRGRLGGAPHAQRGAHPARRRRGRRRRGPRRGAPPRPAGRLRRPAAQVLLGGAAGAGPPGQEAGGARRGQRVDQDLLPAQHAAPLQEPHPYRRVAPVRALRVLPRRPAGHLQVLHGPPGGVRRKLREIRPALPRPTPMLGAGTCGVWGCIRPAGWVGGGAFSPIVRRGPTAAPLSHPRAPPPPATLTRTTPLRGPPPPRHCSTRRRRR